MPETAPETLDWFAAVAEFTVATDSARRPTPGLVDADVRALRCRLIREEWAETHEAMTNGDLAEVADGLADLIYVANGTAIAYGIDLRPVFAAVHAANMAKLGGPRREDGKILKPAGWKPADVEALLAAQPPIPEIV